MFLRIGLILLTGYLLGGCNGALVVSRFVLHEDIRTSGSGNAGFTNMMRSYGKKHGLAVAAIDILKTVVACALGRLLLPELAVFGCLLAGIAAQLGHVFPPLFGFKGGKGFICGMAAVLVADWRAFLAALAVLMVVTLLTQYVSVASLCATLTYTVLLCVWHPQAVVMAAAVGMAILVFWMHRKNIARLLTGTETHTNFFAKSTPADEMPCPVKPLEK